MNDTDIQADEYVAQFQKCRNSREMAGLLSTHPGFSDKHPEYALMFVNAIRGNFKS